MAGLGDDVLGGIIRWWAVSTAAVVELGAVAMLFAMAGAFA